jgi:hypothetical protein
LDNLFFSFFLTNQKEELPIILKRRKPRLGKYNRATKIPLKSPAATAAGKEKRLLTTKRKTRTGWIGTSNMCQT